VLESCSSTPTPLGTSFLNYHICVAAKALQNPYNTQHREHSHTGEHKKTQKQHIMNDLEIFTQRIKTSPEKIEFDEVIEIINNFYKYTPVRFTNGAGNETVDNAVGENEGSCKIFSFSRLQQLNETQTLNCFGRYYREDVLKHPQGSDHANIRRFIQYGWQHIIFDNTALKLKK
jgi:mRNA-degrading endonuclease YafQ of YafQ-DinJ toxin-antitoxin module